MREVWQPKTPQARRRLGERSIDRAVIACVGREKVIGQDKVHCGHRRRWKQAKNASTGPPRRESPLLARRAG